MCWPSDDFINYAEMQECNRERLTFRYSNRTPSWMVTVFISHWSALFAHSEWKNRHAHVHTSNRISVRMYCGLRTANCRLWTNIYTIQSPFCLSIFESRILICHIFFTRRFFRFFFVFFSPNLSTTRNYGQNLQSCKFETMNSISRNFVLELELWDLIMVPYSLYSLKFKQ